MAMSSDDAFADEIVEIFVEEVGEVLDQIDNNLPLWEANFTNQTPLKEVRRAFHTLKGSGRMVQADEIGELAWSIESMLNRIIDGTIKHNPAIFELVREVRKVVPSMLVAFQNKQSIALAGVNIAHLITQASDIVAGKVVDSINTSTLNLSPEMTGQAKPVAATSGQASVRKDSGRKDKSAEEDSFLELNYQSTTETPVMSAPVDMVEVEMLKERIAELSLTLNELKRSFLSMNTQIEGFNAQLKTMPKGIDPVAINKQLKAADQEIQELKYYIKASSEKMMSDVNDTQRRLDVKVDKELRNVTGLRAQLESEMQYMGKQLRLEFGGMVKKWAIGCSLGCSVLLFLYVLIAK